MVPAKQFRDATSRIFPVQLTGDRLPFFGAQRRTPTHQAIPQNIPRKGGHLSRSKSATIRTCRYNNLSPRMSAAQLLDGSHDETEGCQSYDGRESFPTA